MKGKGEASGKHLCVYAFEYEHEYEHDSLDITVNVKMYQGGGRGGRLLYISWESIYVQSSI